MKAALHFHRLDVARLLEDGHEPFPEIRRRMDALQPGEGLEILSPFLPSPLIERLGSDGYEQELEHDPGGAWITRFWRSGPSA